MDEHIYADNEFYQLYHDMYDHYDRSGPKIYVGEYAMIVDNKNGMLFPDDKTGKNEEEA